MTSLTTDPYPELFPPLEPDKPKPKARTREEVDAAIAARSIDFVPTKSKHSIDSAKGAIFLDEIAEQELNSFDPENRPEAQEWTSNLSANIDYIVPFPGIVQDIQRWILKTSLYEQPGFAYIAAQCVVGVAVGRITSVQNIKGTVMAICMAESGEGKDWPFKAAARILEAVDMGDRVYKKLASGAALMDVLNENPSALLHLDEAGNYLNAINGKGANGYAKEIMGIITECYTSGGDSFTGKRIKDHAPDPIIEPNICVMGASTENQVFDSLRTTDVADGSISRFQMVFGDNGLMPKRLPRDMSREVPEHIVTGLKELIRARNKGLYLYSKQLTVSEEYHNEMYKMFCNIKRMSNKLKGDKAAFKPVYNRIGVRCVSAAMNIDGCQSIDVLNWVKNIELKGLDVFIKKFIHLGADNENEKLAKLLQAKIKESGINGITAKGLLQKTRSIQPHVRKMMLEEMITNNMIHIERKKVNGSTRETQFYFWTK